MQDKTKPDDSVAVAVGCRLVEVQSCSPRSHCYQVSFAFKTPNAVRALVMLCRHHYAKSQELPALTDPTDKD